ncbi:hypothetical protein D3C72_1361300 [compost metagenome]
MVKLDFFSPFFANNARRVIFRRGGDSDKHADMPLAGSILFYPCDGAHQLHAADFRVRNARHDLINQVETFTGGNILQIAPFQIIHIG